MAQADCPVCGTRVELPPIVTERRVGFCNACGVELDVARGETGAGVGREMVVYEPMAVMAPPPWARIVERVVKDGVVIDVDHTTEEKNGWRTAGALSLMFVGFGVGAALESFRVISTSRRRNDAGGDKLIA